MISLEFLAQERNGRTWIEFANLAQRTLVTGLRALGSKLGQEFVWNSYTISNTLLILSAILSLCLFIVKVFWRYFKTFPFWTVWSPWTVCRPSSLSLTGSVGPHLIVLLLGLGDLDKRRDRHGIELLEGLVEHVHVSSETR